MEDIEYTTNKFGENKNTELYQRCEVEYEELRNNYGYLFE